MKSLSLNVILDYILIKRTQKICSIFLFFCFYNNLGYETTSTTLAYAAYVLATIPEEQQKLRDEMGGFFDLDSDVNIFQK